MNRWFRRAIFLGVLGSLVPLPQAVQAAPVVFVADSPQAKSARSAFASSKPLILGYPLHPVDSEELVGLVKELTGAPYNGAAQYNEGLRFTEAAKFLRWKLQTNSTERLGLVFRVYRDAFGRNPTQAEQSYWLPRVQTEGKWWFATMMPTNVKWMNESDPNEKKQSVLRSYRAGFGREATPAELAKDLKTNGRYRTLRDARRNFLWGGSPEGKAELLAVFSKIAQTYYKVPKGTALDSKQVAFFAFIYNGSGRKPTFQDIDGFEKTKKWVSPDDVIPAPNI